MRRRAKVQAPKTVQAKLDNLPSEATPEERQMLSWMLCRGKYPEWRYEVYRAIEAEINLKGNVDLHASNARVMNAEVCNERKASGSLNINQMLSVENQKNSFNVLSGLKPPSSHKPLLSIDDLRYSFEKHSYFLGDDDIFTVYQAIQMGKPLLVSGPPGVGKSELAEQIALAMGLDLENQHHYNKLFCTPDITRREAIYEWNDVKRLHDLELINRALGSMIDRLSEDSITSVYREIAANTYGQRYLEVRQLLSACLIPFRTVRLIDEADKPYPSFDNELLDIVAYFRCEIPEYGLVGKPMGNLQDSPVNPFFVLTVNDSTTGGRELSPMLVSRCTPLFLNYLPPQLEEKIIYKKCGIDKEQAGKIAQFFYSIRTNSELRMRNPPSTREVIATANSLQKLHWDASDKNLFRLHSNWVKNRLDLETLRGKYTDATKQWRGLS